ncbi:hypothetical protein [Pontiella agarivorans]|uniref:Uncharacterized protein n=1 Tax=Pontiella agarivorans TaxID=3038953 RepID=A0ABU5MVW4_9BACT|nr:hypothetical protein [Pontiella agarivorans]MDZ8118262.1 hypothetical protein [Pontiella agarivorans]
MNRPSFPSVYFVVHKGTDLSPVISLSNPKLVVERAVLDGFGNVVQPDDFGDGEAG